VCQSLFENVYQPKAKGIVKTVTKATTPSPGTIAEANPNEQREKIKMGKLDNFFTMVEISIN